MRRREIAVHKKSTLDQVSSSIVFSVDRHMPEILFFPYFGPNRRSDRRVVELHLDFSTGNDIEFPKQVSDIRLSLIEAGVLHQREHFPEQALREDRVYWYSSLLVQTALLLQRKNGHRVGYFSISCQLDKNRCTALVEHEHSEVGMAAVKLAVKVFSGHSGSLAEAYKRFSEFARKTALPLETAAIIRAARQAGIPCFQLEREPLSGRFNTGHRVRKNGLLMLGHGAASHLLDGTFCIDKAGERLKAMLRNPDQRKHLLQQLGIPVIQNRSGAKPERALFHLLVVNGRITALTELAQGQFQVISEAHTSFMDLVRSISKEVGFVPLAISLQARDLSQPLENLNGVVVDFDLAPDLQLFLGGLEGGAELLDSAAGHLVNWLFPDKSIARMPSIAVTGTNGKTTTSRMISHILRESGRKPGLVCTDGIFLNGKQVSDGDASSFIGHARVLTSKLVDVAVLETHHRGIVLRGFAFNQCHVAVCLNVTEEHIEVGEIESVEQMTRIKRALLERANDAVVLFADDPNCLSMIGSLHAEKVCLVSLRFNLKQLREMVAKDKACFCVLESLKGEEWLVFYANDERIPVMPVNRIPATFDGTARFNVSNAMHALAATYLLDVDIESIVAALGKFKAGQELTPGRLNVFDDLPFRVIMDFAHNPDGMQKICEFTDRQNTQGRKLIAFAGLGKRSDELNRKSAQAVAGHFDFYFCKDIEPSKPPKRRFTGPFMQQVLIDEGVSRDATTVLTFGKEVMFRIFDACEPGDLLLLLLGHFETGKVPGYIQEYQAMKQGSGIGI